MTKKYNKLKLIPHYILQGKKIFFGNIGITKEFCFYDDYFIINTKKFLSFKRYKEFCFYDDLLCWGLVCGGRNYLIHMNKVKKNKQTFIFFKNKNKCLKDFDIFMKDKLNKINDDIDIISHEKMSLKSLLKLITV